MRVLFVAPYVPSLIRVRPYNFIRSLTALGCEVTVVALGVDGAAEDDAARAELLPHCRSVHIVPLSKREAALNCLISLPTTTPLWAAYCASRAMDKRLREIVEDGAFDIVHVEHLRAGNFINAFSDRLPTVYDSVDCLTTLQSQLMRARDRGLLSRTVSAWEHMKLCRYEPRLAARYGGVLVTSRRDAGYLASLAAAQNIAFPIEVIPNGVDLDYFQPQPELASGEPALVFTGKMSYAANHDAALYFCREILPLIRTKHPGATLTIAGSGPRPDLAALAAQPDSGITVTGRVDDLRPFLARAAIAICPLRIGVGIQNKVLEAMAMGKAVVATPLAANGLESAAAGTAVAVGEGAQEFANCVIDLLSNQAEAHSLGAHARAYVESNHDWSRAAANLMGVYQLAIGQRLERTANPLPVRLGRFPRRESCNSAVSAVGSDGFAPVSRSGPSRP